jgi:hypothetical protein
MTPLRQAIDDYIALRRSLGFKLRRMAEGLREFAIFLEQKPAPYVTTELAMEWAMLLRITSPVIGRNDSVLSAYLPAIGKLRTRARRFPRQGYSRFGRNAPDLICIRNRRFKNCWPQP